MPNKKNIHIVDSYKVWKPREMQAKIIAKATEVLGTKHIVLIEYLLNRTFKSMFIEWLLHNIGYYLTLPLCKIPYFKALNNRFKDVDLEEWKK